MLKHIKKPLPAGRGFGMRLLHRFNHIGPF